MRVVIYDKDTDYHGISNAILKAHVHVVPGYAEELSTATDFAVAVVHVRDFRENARHWDDIKHFKKLFFYSLDDADAKTFASEHQNLADHVAFVRMKQLSRGLRDAVLTSDPDSLFENHLSSALELLSALYEVYLEWELGVLSVVPDGKLELEAIRDRKTASRIALGALHDRLLEKSACQSPLPCTTDEFISKLTTFRNALLSWAAR